MKILWINLEMEDIRDRLELPEEYDLVMVWSGGERIAQAYYVARWYGRIGVPVVIGGGAVTASPLEALASGATVVLGGLDGVWGHLLEDAEVGALRAVYDGRVGQGGTVSHITGIAAGRAA